MGAAESDEAGRMTQGAEVGASRWSKGFGAAGGAGAGAGEKVGVVAGVDGDVVADAGADADAGVEMDADACWEGRVVDSSFPRFLQYPSSPHCPRHSGQKASNKIMDSVCVRSAVLLCWWWWEVVARCSAAQRGDKSGRGGQVAVPYEGRAV